MSSIWFNQSSKGRNNTKTVQTLSVNRKYGNTFQFTLLVQGLALPWYQDKRQILQESFMK